MLPTIKMVYTLSGQRKLEVFGTWHMASCLWHMASCMRHPKHF